MKHLLSASLLLLISPFVSAGIPFEFDEPVRINYTDRGSSRPLVVSNSLGHVVVVWSSSSSSSGERLYVSSKSNDFGATWSTPIRVDNGISSNVSTSDFRITAVSDIGIAVVWRHFNADSVYCAYSADFGSSWLEYNSRIDDGSPGTKGSVSIASDGERLVAVWCDRRTGWTTVQSSWTLDRGMTWSSPDIRVDDDNTVLSTKSFLALHANSDGSFLATWADNRNNDNFDIWSSRSADGGLSWSENIQVHSDYPGYQQFNASGEGTSGDVHIVYWNSTGVFTSEINSATSMDFGLTWTDTPDTINDPPLNYDCGEPSITGCMDGTLVTIWNDNRTGDRFTYLSFSEDLGATWSQPNTLIITGRLGTPDICALPDGGFMVVYQDRSMSELPYYAIRARRVEPTPTTTPTGQFPGTNTPIPTRPPTSTPTPADQTAIPSPTFTPPATPTFPDAPTATPTPLVTGVTITMPAHQYRPGDPCYCMVTVTNGDPEPLIDHPLIVILDVYGEYFYAPSFTGDFDYYAGPWPHGTTPVDALPVFTWPDTGTTASGIIWYAAITDPAVTRIVGEWDAWEFGWL
jgi:hypothetical protein